MIKHSSQGFAVGIYGNVSIQKKVLLCRSVLQQDLFAVNKLKEIVIFSETHIALPADIRKILLKRNVTFSVIKGKHRDANDAAAIRSIFSAATSDILICISATVTLGSSSVLQLLINPMTSDHSVGLCGARCIQKLPKTFLEGLFMRQKEGRMAGEHLFDISKTAYAVESKAFAIRTALAKNIVIPDEFSSLGPFIYFSVRSMKQAVRYVKRSIFYYETGLQQISDAIGERTQFYYDMSDLSSLFHEDTVEKAFALPTWFLFRTAIHEIVTNPLGFFITSVVDVIAKINVKFHLFYSFKVLSHSRSSRNFRNTTI